MRAVSERTQGALTGLAQLDRRRAALSAAVLLVAAFVGFKGYEWLRPAPAPTAPIQTVQAANRSIVERVSLPGTAGSSRQAKLSFSASSSGVSVSGIVESISVRTGDSVKAGQPVASLDTTSLDLAVLSARSSLSVAQLKMQTLLAGALPPDAAAAEQSVISATAAYQKAMNDLAALQGGASASDLASATQAALTAQNSLTSAQVALDNLQRNVDSEAAGAQARAEIDRLVAQNAAAQSILDAAWNGHPALAGLVSAEQSALENLRRTIDARCTLRGNGDRCTSAALSATDLDSLVNSVNDATDKVPADFGPTYQTLVQAVAPDRDILADPIFRVLQATAALPGLTTRANNAVQALDTTSGIPTAQTLANAVRARDAAAAAAQAAQAKVAALVQGPTGSDLQAASNAVANAKASLDTATLKRDQLVGGPLPSDVALQEASVTQADISLRRALNDQAGAVLLAPFDGVIGTITMNVGEPSGSGSIILLDPKAMQLNATAQEADVVKLKVGQTVALTFDAFAGVTVPGRVSSIAPAADIVQGVPSYAVIIEVSLAGASARGTTAIDLRAGMAGTAGVEIQRHDNVLAIPSRAVKRQGRAQVVQVMLPDGKQETRTIQIGASDGTYTEVTSGLQEGDAVVIPGSTTTTTTGTGSLTPGNVVIPGGLAPGGGFGGGR